MSVEDLHEVAGVTGGHAVVKIQSGTDHKWIELYDDEWDTILGTLPAETGADTISTVLSMINRAFDRGFETGKARKQYELCEVLGVHRLVRDLKDEIRER
jgi:hypothetical protein